MQGGFVMIGHMLIIVLVLYLIMYFALGLSQREAEDRSVFLGGIALVYMVLYGHGMPTRANSLLF
jgi:hypothetical protein